MRALIAIAILGGTLAGLAVFPAQAGGGGRGGGAMGHIAVASRAHFAIVSGHGRNVIVLHHGAHHFGRRGFGRGATFGGFGGFGTFGPFDQFALSNGFFGLDGSAVVGASPSVVIVPQAVAGAAPPAPAAVVGELPPCREVMAGVVIQRGGACRGRLENAAGRFPGRPIASPSAETGQTGPAEQTNDPAVHGSDMNP
jgi:hypothetical protein